MKLFELFKVPPPIEEMADKKAIQKKYKYWRLRIFYSMYIGYVFYYFTRKSFTFAMPSMMADLNFDKAELGILASILSISYGFSKFLSGIIADRSNPRFFMGFGLILTGIFNIFFGFSSSLLFFALFWGMNGIFQGWGWPPCARLLTHWYSQKERGRWWGSWSTAHSVGGFLIPIVVAAVCAKFGWRYALYVPGTLCIFMGFFLINRLRDTPESLGLPSIEKFQNDYPEDKQKEADGEKMSSKEILMRYVFKNKLIWALALSYFFVYVIRTAINDWTMLFLVESKGYGQMNAAFCVSLFEIGGIFGSLLAGWASDWFFDGKRGPVNVLFCFALIFAILGFWFSPVGAMWLDYTLMLLVGFLTFGPQMLIGMAAAELSHKRAAATATGFVGWIAYLGAASAGWPLGFVTDKLGWEGFFMFVIGSAILSTLILLPLWNVASGSSQEEGVILEDPVAES